MPYVPGAGRPNLDLHAPQINGKQDVNYRQADVCASCGNYDGRGRCTVVKGSISSNCVCDMWSKTASMNNRNMKAYFSAVRDKINRIYKVNKSDVNYRVFNSCSTCGQFNGRNGCNEVRGSISPGALCDLWTLEETISIKTGKEYIESEYEKSKGG